MVEPQKPEEESEQVPRDQDQEILVKAFVKSLTDAMQDARAATLAANIEEAATKAALEYIAIKSALQTFPEKQKEQELRGKSNV